MLVFALGLAFVAAWTAVYFLVIRPKLRAFRYTAGIYKRLDELEAGLWPKLVLLLKGAKVAIVAFITSAAPVVGLFYEKIAGLDWSQFLPSEKARMVGLVILGLGIFGPVLMAALHNGALADAAAAEPHKPEA